MAEAIVYEEKICDVKWGSFVLIGLLALIIGIVIFIYPQITAAVLVMLFGVLVTVLAFITLIAALMHRGGSAHPTYLLILAIIGFIVGLGSLFAPQFFAAFLAIIIAVVMFVIGLMNIIIALTEKGYPHRWLLFLLGLLSIIFAILVMAYPLYGAVVLFGFLVGAFFVLYGILSIIAGLALRSVKNEYCKA